MNIYLYLIIALCFFSHSTAQEWTEFSAVLKPSPIHGVGVFATHDLAQGTRLFAEVNYRLYKLDELPEELHKYCQYLGENQGRGPERFDRMEVDWYLNHSNNPNVAEIKEEYWITLRDVKSGEELLIDYNQFNEPEHLKEPFYRN